MSPSNVTSNTASKSNWRWPGAWAGRTGKTINLIFEKWTFIKISFLVKVRQISQSQRHDSYKMIVFFLKKVLLSPPKIIKLLETRPWHVIHSIRFQEIETCMYQNISNHMKEVKIVTAFRGMHVSPAKHSSASVTDGQTDRRIDDGQSDPYVSLCFPGDTKIHVFVKHWAPSGNKVQKRYF